MSLLFNMLSRLVITFLPRTKRLLISWLQSPSVVILDPMGCSLPGSSVHGILQARILEWVTIPFSRGSSQLRGQILVFLHWQADSLPLSHQGVAIRRGEVAQMKCCWEPRCFPRGNPACRGTFGGHRKAVRDRLATLPNKGPSSQGYGFSSGHVWM